MHASALSRGPSSEADIAFSGCAGGVYGLYTALTAGHLPGHVEAVAQGNALGKGPLVFELYKSGIDLIRRHAAGMPHQQEYQWIQRSCMMSWAGQQQQHPYTECRKTCRHAPVSFGCMHVQLALDPDTACPLVCAKSMAEPSSQPDLPPI